MRKFRRDKPTIYWHYYPESERGFWRVSPCPRPLTASLRLWQNAHYLVNRMNMDIAIKRPVSRMRTVE